MWDYKPPVEYTSLTYLQLGCIGNIKAILTIYNTMSANLGLPVTTLQVKRVIENESHIIITGKYRDGDNLEDILHLCKWYTAAGVLVTYEKTLLQFEI